MLKKILTPLVALALVASSALAQPSATPVDTNTPTPADTATPTFPVAVPTLTSQQIQRLVQANPGLKWAKFDAILQAIIADTNSGVKAKVVVATDAAALPIFDTVTSVVGIFAFTTSSGAAASKAILDVDTDYTVADGVVTAVGDHSTQTWLVLYKR